MCSPRYSLNPAGYDYRYGAGYDYELGMPYGSGVQRRYGMAPGMPPYRPGYGGYGGCGGYPMMGGGGGMIDPVGGAFECSGCPKDKRYRPAGICVPGPMAMGGNMYGSSMMMMGGGGYGGSSCPFGFQSRSINPLAPYTKLRKPFSATCLRCGSLVTTVTHHKIGSFGAASALCLSVLGLCWLPLYAKSFKDVIHYCPCCGSQIAIHKTAH